MKTLLAIAFVILIAESYGHKLPEKHAVKQVAQLSSEKKDDTPVRNALDPARLPVNTFALDTDPYVILQCGVDSSSVTFRIHWSEFTTGSERTISDNEIIQPGHPNAARYSIVHNDAYDYSLQIIPLLMSDGGQYLCDDASASLTDKKSHSASLTVGAAVYNCSTTLRANGVVLEGQYITNECQINYKGGIIPNLTWVGLDPFRQTYTTTDTTIWAGMDYNATREMDTRSYSANFSFSNYFLPVDGNTADNVPDYFGVYQVNQMFVYWIPTSMVAYPLKDDYEVGDIVTCQADARPAPSYLWQNLRTTLVTNNQQFIIDDTWIGTNQTMRCEARNIIDGQLYSANYFLDVNVPALTTPTVTTPPITTSPPPAVSPCTDLTGPWESVSGVSAASLCIKLDLTNNGALTGLFMNGTDSYWIDIVGRAQADNFAQVGFNGIWAYKSGVSSFIGECHRCFGDEMILVDVVSRSKGSPCGTPGPVQYNDKYTFKRSTTVTCVNLPVSS